MGQYATKTLGQIVAGNYKAASVFDRYELDFCCGGKKTLEEACQRKQLSLEEIENDLTRVLADSSGEFPFRDMSPSMLIGYILIHHHFYIQQNMALILQHLEKVAHKHGESFPYMKRVAELFTELEEELMGHMKKEELILFPAIREIERLHTAGTSIESSLKNITAPMMVMEKEHDIAGRLIEEIRRLTSQYVVPEAACSTFRISLMELKEFDMKLHEHVHLENNILFERVREMIA
jgi:regulator of cell morphogenesis and NO signaling